MAGFLGAFEHQMDEKGRVALPAAFRREAEGSPLFVYHGWGDPMLTVVLPSVWNELLARLMEARRSSPAMANRVRQLLAMAAELAPDKQGRILIPPSLQTAVALAGPVLMNGHIDRIEMWNPDRFHAAIEPAAAGDGAEFENLKNRLLL